MKNNWLLIGGFAFILLLPLLNAPPLFAPPEWSKAEVFRILTFLGIAGLGLATALGNAPFLPAVKKAVSSHKELLALLGGYIGALVLSTALSPNPQMGFLGIPIRGGGALDLILLLLFAVALLVFLSKSHWNILWNVAVGTGIGVALIALFQQFGSSSDLFVTGVFRPGSTIGGPAFLASYLLLLLFPALGFGLTKTHPAYKAFYFGAVTLFVAVMFLGLTRGAYLGLLAGGFWFIGWYPHSYSYQHLVKRILLILIILGFAGIGYLNLFQLPQQLQENTFFTALHDRLQIESLLEARYGTWAISWEAVKDQPLLGYGIENALSGLNKNFDPSLPGVSNPSEGWWLDRGHNIILDTLLAGGLIALIFLVSFFVMFFKRLQQAKRDYSKSTFIHALQAGLIAYIAANLTSFDSFSIQLILFFAIAWGLWLISDTQPEHGNTPTASVALRIAGLLLIPASVVVLWQFALNPLLVNAKVNQGTELSSDVATCQNAIEVFESIDADKQLEVVRTYVKTQHANALNRCAQQSSQFASLQTKQYELLRDILQSRPEHAEAWIRFGGLATNLAEQVLGQGDAETAQLLLGNAEQSFLTAQELSPNRPSLYNNWAVKETVVGQYELAHEKAVRCLELDEQRTACWWWKGIAEILLGDVLEGESSIQRAEQQGYNVNGLAQLGQLARSYATTGQYAKAREAALLLLEKQPENKTQIEAFLNSLPN